MNTLNRRKFLSSSALLATSSLISVTANAACKDPMPAKWDEEVDVIVVGSGFAGLAAAAEAKNANAGNVIPLEMAMTPELAEGVIRSIPGYRPYFEKAFGSKNPTFSEIAEALAAFETTLTTPNAPFERYLKGDKNALTQQQIDGLKLFRRSGCIRCHSGNLLGGTSFQKVGSVRPYVTDNSSKGRMDVSGKPWDEMMFKVPTLLNVERTAPYFHDGAVKTLPDAVKKMADIQLDMNLSEKQVEEIVAFLESLNGELPKIEKPTLPPSGPETRKYIEEVY